VQNSGAGGDEGMLVAVEFSPVRVPIPAEPEGCERRNHCVAAKSPWEPLSKQTTLGLCSQLKFIVCEKLVLSGK